MTLKPLIIKLDIKQMIYIFWIVSKGKYRSTFIKQDIDDDELCGIGIHGQWLWINPKK